MTDTKLIQLMKEKNEKAFIVIFNTYKNLVFYECMCVLNNREDAEDVLQEVFVEFFNTASKIEKDISIKLYLAGLAKRRAIDLYRKKKTRLEYAESDIESFGAIDDAIYNFQISLSELLTSRETQIVAKKVLFDYTFNEIAQELITPIGTIQSIYYAALEKLKKYYKGV